MGNTFSTSEIQSLRRSAYVESVTEKQIYYGKRFELEYHRLIQAGYTPTESFEFLGLAPDIVGKERITKYNYRYHNERKAELDQAPTPEVPQKTLIQELKEKEAENELLKQEVEFLKKKDQIMHQFKQRKK